MSTGHSLLDAAVKACGSRYKVAKATGISQTTLSLIASGKQGMGPTTAAKLAAVAGLDATKAAAVAIIEAEKDPVERQVLERVFFQGAARAMLVFSIAGGWLTLSPTTADAVSSYQAHPVTSCEVSDRLYIMSTVRWLRNRLRRAISRLFVPRLFLAFGTL